MRMTGTLTPTSRVTVQNHVSAVAYRTLVVKRCTMYVTLSCFSLCRLAETWNYNNLYQ